MTIAAVQRWQWVLVSVVVGLALWGVRRWGEADLGRFGDTMNDPLRFERALLTEVPGVGLPQFRGVRVHRQALRDETGASAAKTVHVVAGRYCDGRLDPRDGKYHWRPTVFLAPEPYRPTSYLLDVVDADSAARFEALPAPTVIDFLELMKSTRGVAYTHAWWDTYPALTWIGGSVVLIGIVWPTVVNLVVFHSLRRPPGAKALSLWGAESRAGKRPDGGHPTEAELDQLRRLNADLEADLAADARAGRPGQPGEARPATAAALAGGPLDPLAPVAPGEEPVFGAAPEDFYPTAAHAAPRVPHPGANGGSDDAGHHSHGLGRGRGGA